MLIQTNADTRFVAVADGLVYSCPVNRHVYRHVHYAIVSVVEDITTNLKQEAQLMLRNPARRDFIRREEKYRQVLHRRTAVSYMRRE